jgi:hypothetical protein
MGGEEDRMVNGVRNDAMVRVNKQRTNFAAPPSLFRVPIPDCSATV